MRKGLAGIKAKLFQVWDSNLPNYFVSTHKPGKLPSATWVAVPQTEAAPLLRGTQDSRPGSAAECSAARPEAGSVGGPGKCLPAVQQSPGWAGHRSHHPVTHLPPPKSGTHGEQDADNLLLSSRFAQIHKIPNYVALK